MTWNHTSYLDGLVKILKTKFDRTYLGHLLKYLRIEYLYTDKGIYLHQATYATEILAEFGMDECNPSHIPLNEGLKLSTDMGTEEVDSPFYRSIVGKLNFLATTRPDIAFAVNMTARFQERPQQTHLLVAKGILRYIKKTVKYGLCYKKRDPDILTGFTDADWGNDKDTRRSTGGFLFKLGDSLVSWHSKR